MRRTRFQPPPFRSFGAHAVLLSLKEAAAMNEKPTKPVVPHYSPTRRLLWNAAGSMDKEAEEIERGFQYHRDQLQQGADKVARLRERSAALKAAADALGGMDKAGIVVTPDSKPPGVV